MYNYYYGIPDGYSIYHFGRSKADGAPGPGSGRYPLGSGDRPYQGVDKNKKLKIISAIKNKKIMDEISSIKLTQNIKNQGIDMYNYILGHRTQTAIAATSATAAIIAARRIFRKNNDIFMQHVTANNIAMMNNIFR